MIKPVAKQKRVTKPGISTAPSNPYPYRKPNIRVPREISSASSLWLDFFQQFADSTVADSPGAHGDKAAIGRARILADYALEAFQDRFPGVHPTP